MSEPGSNPYGNENTERQSRKIIYMRISAVTLECTLGNDYLQSMMFRESIHYMKEKPLAQP